MMESFDYIIIFGFSFIAVCGFIGNSFVVYVFRNDYTNNQIAEMDMLILILAFIDLVTSLLNSALFIYWQVTSYDEWIFGRMFCKILPGIQKMSITVSLGIILLIIVDRALIIVKNRRVSKRRLKIIVALIVFFSFCMELRTMINLDLHASKTKISYVCYPNESESFTFAKNFSYSAGAIGNISYVSKSYTCDEVAIRNLSLSKIQANINYFKDEKSNLLGNLQISDILHMISQQRGFCVRSCKALMYGCTTRAGDNVYVMMSFILLRMLITLVVVVVCNTFIYRSLYERKRLRTLSGQKSALNPRKVFRLIVVMASVFVLLVFPKDVFVLVYTLSWLQGFGVPYEIALKVNGMLTLLQNSNSICNIFIYARLHKRIRSAINSSKLMKAGKYDFIHLRTMSNVDSENGFRM